MEKYLAARYMENNHINGRITAILIRGFQYVLQNGERHYVPYRLCK